MAKEKIYYSILELQPTVDKLYKEGITKGKDLGFQCLSELYSIKPGATSYVMGSPTSGKTELWFEVLVNLSEFYGWKHVIYTPETGNKEEIIAELSSKFLCKPFYKNFEGFMNDNEKYQALAWLNEHFWIIDPAEKDITVTEFYEVVDSVEKEYKVKINTTTIDPYNELKHDMKEANGRQDLYIETMLGLCRRNAVANNRHNCIITHCADQQPITESGITYYPPPTARQYSGGQAWYRKGMGMIGVWRPPFGLCDREGRPYGANEVHVIVQKAKPKGIGNKGVAKMFFDVKRNRYYEEFEGNNYYARKLGGKPQSIDFPTKRIADKKEVRDEIPF